MGFPLKVGDKVVYTHCNDPDAVSTSLSMSVFYQSSPITRVSETTVWSFCPAPEEKVRPVDWYFFVLRTELLCLIRNVTNDA